MTNATTQSSRSKSLFLDRRVICLTALGALFFWIFIALKVPINNDEAIHYHPIACAMYPLSWMHQFRERCGEKDLFLLGMWLPFRSFWYSGSSTAFFFFPFWWLFRDPIVIRVWTGILWLLSSLLMAGILRVPWPVIIGTVMVSIPVLSQHIVDTGPITLQLVAVQTGIILVLHSATCRSFWKTLLAGALAGLCIFLAIEQKIFVVHALVLVAYLLLAGVLARTSKWAGKNVASFAHLVVAGVIALIVSSSLLYVLFSATTRGGSSYFSLLQSVKNSYSFNQLPEWREHFARLFREFVILSASYFHRNYPIEPERMGQFASGIIATKCLVGVLGVLALLLIKERNWKGLSLVVLSPLAALGDLFWISQSVRAWAGHHVIFAHIIAFIGVSIGVAAIEKRHRWMALMLVCVMIYVNVAPSVAIANSKPFDHTDPTRGEIFAVVDEPTFAKKYLVVHSGWGTFFIDALFGPKDQAVTWVDNLDDENLKQLARSNNRKLAIVTMSSPGWERYAHDRGWRLHTTSSSGQWELWVEE